MKHPLDYLLDPLITLGLIVPLSIAVMLGLAAIIVAADPKPEQCRKLDGILVKTPEGTQCIKAQILRP